MSVSAQDLHYTKGVMRRALNRLAKLIPGFQLTLLVENREDGSLSFILRDEERVGEEIAPVDSDRGNL